MLYTWLTLATHLGEGSSSSSSSSSSNSVTMALKLAPPFHNTSAEVQVGDGVVIMVPSAQLCVNSYCENLMYLVCSLCCIIMLCLWYFLLRSLFAALVAAAHCCIRAGQSNYNHDAAL
jgi:hypothetical protein